MAAPGSFFASSPTVVLPPQQPSQYFPTGHYVDAASGGPPPPNGFGGSFPTNDPILPTPGALAGRKRSRGDCHAPEDEEEGLEDGSTQTDPAAASSSAAKPRGKPVYGPGMTLIYPEDPGYAPAAESQSGTWVEERTERNQFQLTRPLIDRPCISTRKSQRLDANAAAPDDLAQLVLPPQIREVTAEPLIDEATRALGISWIRMDSSEALRINQAAYSKWIQNHYSGLKDVTVWFENSALPGYLAVATNAYGRRQEYYIFSHDLTEARLVTSDPSQLVPRMQMLPALHLAAPGGCIRAEMDPIVAVRDDEVDGVQMAAEAAVVGNGEDDPASMLDVCSAQSMELD